MSGDMTNERESKLDKRPSLRLLKSKKVRRSRRLFGKQHNWRQFRDFVRQEAINVLSEKNDEELGDRETSSEVNQELEQLLNMTRIPFQLERFMIWTLLACLDCFLHYFTVMPIKVIREITFKLKNRRKQRLSKSSNERTMAILIMVAWVILSKLDTSKAYHRIKRQSSVKLYMLFAVLEMADKMLASIGQSLLTVLQSGRNAPGTLHIKALLLSVCIIYLVFHGYIMIYQTIALNVAVNSYSNALLTLLLSIQFTEIKASLFKRTDKEGLFQLTIADLVERSQLILLLIIIALRNVIAKSKSQSAVIPNSWALKASSSIVVGVLCGPMCTVLGSELVVDWIKHAYVTKFNRIRPQIYSKFLSVMCEDHSISLHKFRDRLGLPVPALVLLFLVMMKPTLAQVIDTSSVISTAQAILLLTVGFIFLTMFKITLHILLLKWGLTFRSKSHIWVGNEHVPGEITGGSAKIDHRARTIIHNAQDSKGGETNTNFQLVSPLATPTQMNDSSQVESEKNHLHILTEGSCSQSSRDSGKKKNLKSSHSLDGVARYKMVSKRIW